jgi:GDPmannose 4,6-dehydratase
MTRVFVTGISGQDGSYLADLLTAEDAEIHGLLRDWDDDARAVAARHPHVQFHVGDLADASVVSGLIQDLDPDEIYNLAGISSVAQSWQLPTLTGQITGVAVATILDAALRLSERRGTPVRVLQASSSEIFGQPTVSPQSETTPIAPNSPYGAAKAYAHHMVRMFRARGLAVSSCILYNHESPRRPEAFVTRKITASAARIAAGVQDVLELGALDVERDWGWAPDYVRAMVLAVRHSDSDDYVISTGTAHTVADFVTAAFAAVGITDWSALVRVNPDFVRPTEISSMIGDSRKAAAALGWHPTVDFTTLVERMVAEDVELVRSRAATGAEH